MPRRLGRGATVSRAGGLCAANDQPSTGSQRPARLRARPRLHGHERVLRRRRRRRVDRHDPRALDAGVDFLDTADMYGPFKNEELVGRAIQGRRDEVVLATKFGIIAQRRRFVPARSTGRPEYVRQACDASLRRLGVDMIDLYYQHRVDHERADRGDRGRDGRAWSRRARCAISGSPKRARRRFGAPHAVHPIAALQSEYSLWRRDPEDGVLETVRELGVGFVAYSPLGRGFLTGAIRNTGDLAQDDFRRSTPRFAGGNFERNLALVDAVRDDRGRTRDHAPRNCRSRGCSAGATTSSRFLARNGSGTSKKTSGLRPCGCPPKRSSGSRRRRPSMPSPGPGTPICPPSIVKGTLESPGEQP